MAIRDNEEHSPVFKLFHYYIRCRIPASFANEHREALIGHLKYHDEKEKEIAAREMISRQHTTVELAEYYDRGAAIIIDDPKDSILMYDWITQYLRDRRMSVKSSLNKSTVPLEDLEILDAWAAELYRIARPNVTIDITKTKSLRKMDAAFGRSMKMRRHLPEMTERDYDDPLKDTPEDHVSISDEIAIMVARRKRGLR